MERRTLSRFWTVVAALVVIAGAAGLPMAAPTSAATPVVITMSSSSPNPSVAGDFIALTFTFSRPIETVPHVAGPYLRISTSAPGTSPGTPPRTDSVELPNGSLGITREVALQDRDLHPIVGTWHIRAYIGYDWPDSNTVELDQVVVPVPASPLLSLVANPAPVDAGTPIRLTATLSGSKSGPPASSASVSFAEADRFLGAAPMVFFENTAVGAVFGRATTSVGPLSAGDHNIVATYLDAAGSPVLTSSPLLVQVIADTSVAARSVGTGQSTFYPVKDAYLDTLAIRGTLDEQASVSISIYSVATGRKVGAFLLSPRSGAYQMAWNGRTSSGTLLLSGKYKVTQVLRDMAGNTKTVTSYATLSQKRMYWQTATQIRFGSDFDDLGVCCRATVSTRLSQFSRGVLVAGYGFDPWPFVTYRFTVPAATAYKNIRFQALGVGGTGLVALWNWRLDNKGGDGLCPRRYSWCSTKSVAGADWVKSRVVSAEVIAQDGGAFDVDRVKLTYTYGILK